MKQAGTKSYGSKYISICLLSAFLITSACSKDNSSEDSANPHTGHDSIETDVAPVLSQITGTTQLGTVVYIYAERIRARSTPEVLANNIAGILDINDQVIILDSKPIGTEKFVKVEVKQSRGIKAGQIVYVSMKYLSNQQRAMKQKENLKYFMVQNLATEKVRVYERCQTNNSKEYCPNKLVFQADMVAGEDQDGTRSNVGIYRIDRWEKFYEDGARRYPAWYRPNYPQVPEPGASRSSWFDSDYMPNEKGDARGAFGWYTAIVSPNASGQWTHGTMGWGADHDDFITFKNGFVGKVVKLFAAIRSHGCSRVDNETVAYLRHLLPVGTTLIKIYAKEVLADNKLTGYSKFKPTWDYILTKSGYGKASGQTADAATVIAQNTPRSEWIEEGRYSIDQYPVDKKGNLYDIKEKEFKGLYLVDHGTLMYYEHPESLGRGGFKDQPIPSYMKFDVEFE